MERCQEPVCHVTLFFLDSAHDGLLFGDGFGEGLFAVDVLFAVGGGGGDQGMPVIGNGDHDGVDVVALDHLAKVVIGLAVGVTVSGVDGVDGGLQMGGVDVAGGDDLAVRVVEEVFGILRAHHAPTDDADGDAVGGRGALLAPGGAGEDGSGTSGLDEVAAGEGRGLARGGHDRLQSLRA